MDIKIIKKSKMFEHMNDSEIPEILKCLGAYTKNYKKKEYVHLEGDSMDNIGLVLSGRVDMIEEDIWGDKTIIAMINAGEVFGESFICGNQDNANISFEAVSSTEILFMSFKKVLTTCGKSCVFHQKLIENMVALIAQKNIELLEKAKLSSKRSIRNKLLTYLSSIRQKSGKQYFVLPLGRIELADYLGVNRSALTRELSHMRDENLLDYDRNTFCLKDSSGDLI